MKTILLVLAFALSGEASATKEGVKYAYISLEPEILTNYHVEGKSMGYIRVGVELVIEDVSFAQSVEQHIPFFRATIIELLGTKERDQIASIEGRAALTHDCLAIFNAHMEKEHKVTPIKSILFSKFLHQTM